MRGIVSGMARLQRTPMQSLTPDEARALYAGGAEVLEIDRPAMARELDFLIPARDGASLPARLVAPEPGDAALPVLLYFHGGGFTVGSVATHDILCRELARLAGCAVVSVDYRLAPQHKFPTASDDAWDSLQWLASHGASIGIDGTRIAIGGDSAGGTLAASCALLARDAGLPIALQLLFYPGCSARQDTASHRRFAHGPIIDAGLIQWFFSHYIRSDADREDWRFAPLLADDLDGVAPAWFGLAECDPLVDEGVDYADRLRAAGVAVDLEIYRGVTHEFIKMGRIVAEARQAHAAAAGALAAALRSA
ncbi:alpha/beta hydrolase fold domain-containing protein [Xylophilus rhododendri]|uniref:Alpha/beta hydrolase fold domain-containing protein n=1 Tax=Xylophilus rhododendri TaxID=2697032 RepID=A0A857JEW1_9BURK|nr:alpha/beta hydrolase [Xylophilus rhododendri]QHJ01339.1 alpha/beta hydrolase fold domain-containing protein [Xylophilus rhododendri]